MNYIFTSGVFIVLALAGCATANLDYLLPLKHGRYGQTYTEGFILMETEYESADHCVNDFRLIIDGDKKTKELIKSGKILIFCAAHSSVTNAPYQGVIKYLNNSKITFARFPSKEICEIIRIENKSKFNNQDLLCP